MSDAAIGWIVIAVAMLAVSGLDVLVLNDDNGMPRSRARYEVSQFLHYAFGFLVARCLYEMILR
jgi:hypothetical protein